MCVCVSRLTETVLGAEQDSVRPLDKESCQPVGVPLEAVDLEMTPVQVAMPTPPSGESEKEGDRASSYEEVRHTEGDAAYSLVCSDVVWQCAEFELDEWKIYCI